MNHYYIKNSAVYYFILDQQNKIHTKQNPFFKSDEEKISVFLNGIIYNCSREGLMSGLKSEGPDFVNKLEGSYVLFVIIENVFYILTDKINSKKAFYGLINNQLHISNDIDLLPKESCDIDLTGLASYLANGNMFDYHTLFNQIKSAQRASVHRVENAKISFYRYWDMKYDYPEKENYNEEEYEKQLEEIIKRVFSEIKKSLSGPVLLSLSAGHDARAILGILKYDAEIPEVNCFSYDLSPEPIKESDSGLAARLAKQVAYPHELIPAYGGDLLAFLKENASEGKGLANLCAEINVWHYLKKKYNNAEIFVGEQHFGVPDAPLEKLLCIDNKTGLDWIKTLLDQDLYNRLKDSITKLDERIYKKVKENGISHPQDTRDYVYLEERCNHVSMLWREYFSSQAGFVHNPFLHGYFLEFISKIPLRLRTNKELFKRVIKKMFPQIYEVEITSKFVNKYHWDRQIHKNRKKLEKLIKETDSRLNDVITREKVLEILNHQDRINLFWYLKNFFQKSVIYGRKHFSFFDKLLNRFIGPVAMGNNKELIMLRLLTLWLHLRKSNNNPL
jgi:asparagine synthetase B (glutamine-hydrolysing)